MTIHQSGITIKEAARVLGISEAAVCQRLLRRTLISTRQNGCVFVLLPEEPDDQLPDNTPDHPKPEPSNTADDPANLPLVAQLHNEIAFLRQQVDIKDRQISELHVMLQTAQRQLPATVPDALHPPERAADDVTPHAEADVAPGGAQREEEVFPKQRWPWWMRILGGR